MATTIYVVGGESITVDDDYNTVQGQLQGVDRFVRFVDSAGYPTVVAREMVTHLASDESAAG